MDSATTHTLHHSNQPPQPCNLASAFGANALAQIHLGNTLFQPLTDWKPISDEIVKAALEIIVDVRSHPVLIVDPYVKRRRRAWCQL
jgi:hypothetical protein